MIVIKIILTIALVLVAIYIGEHEGKTLSDKVSNKAERQWLSIQEIITMVAIFYVMYSIWND